MALANVGAACVEAGQCAVLPLAVVRVWCLRRERLQAARWEIGLCPSAAAAALRDCVRRKQLRAVHAEAVVH